MSDDESKGHEQEKPFAADRPKQGRAKCKKCKESCPAGELRLAKMVPNHFGGGGLMKSWHHPACLWDIFSRQRASTKKLEDPENEIEGWDALMQEDQDFILDYVKGQAAAPTGQSSKKANPSKKTPKKEAPKPSPAKTVGGNHSDKESPNSGKKDAKSNEVCKDDFFREFRRLIVDVANVPSYTAKTAAVKKMLTEGSGGDGFKGNLDLWVRMLLPGVDKRIYNVQSKQLIKLFSRVFEADEDEMLEDLEQGDVAETVRVFFEKSECITPCKKSTLTMDDVEQFLIKLSTLTKEDEQTYHFKQIAKRCTSNDLKMIVRLVKHDLRINAGAKHILDAIHPDAYLAYQSTRDISAVLNLVKSDSSSKNVHIGLKLMTPALPMLAEACKSVDKAIEKCPNGIISEIKYDGERVQVHKKGDEFKYFSRSLKPVVPHKVAHFEQFIPQAFPRGEDLILDSEVLLIDTKSGKPLPFGSLGKHKKDEFVDANVCLFVFDCIYYNGDSLLHKPMKKRRQILENIMTEIPNRVMFSEKKLVYKAEDLTAMIEKVIRMGLEGLVLKDLEGHYEPGKRHWLKVKKDYLSDGAMADTADLVVLGAWYGTGRKGGIMSVFLMGCYDPGTKLWRTVTKVHGGHDDETLERLQTELKMVKISKDINKIPDWLTVNRSMVPDFIAQDPKESPVWEITGAEFTKTEVHTADGISVRFPRVTKIREDKTWKEATSLPELRAIYKKSKEMSEFTLSRSPSTSPSKVAEKRPSSSDGEASTSQKRRKKGPNQALPDIFNGIKISMPDEISSECKTKLRRYFIAYGGTLLNADQKDESTHFVHSSASKNGTLGSKKSNHVNIDWIWDSIRKKKLLKSDNYTIST